MMKKVKCAVYRSSEPWGGGYYYVLHSKKLHHKDVRLYVQLHHYKIEYEPVGIFEFDEDFLNSCFTTFNFNDKEYVVWDGTWIM